MAANTTPVTEGAPAAGQALTQNTATINLANYADFISYSNKVVLTAISNTVAEGSALLAYRGALSVDTVIWTAIDTAAAATTLDRIDVNDGNYFNAAIARKAVWQLRSFDVKPKANGLFFGVTPSLAAYDLINDASASGMADLMKYSERLASTNPALVGIKGAYIGNVGGVDWYESNALTTASAWQGSAHTAYHSYVVGHQAVIASSLGKTNLNQKNFTIKTVNFQEGSNSIDPAALIRAASVYNFFFGLAVAPQHASSDKFRRITAESTIG